MTPHDPKGERPPLPRRAPAAVCAAAGLAFLLSAAPVLADVAFRDPLNNQPLDIPLPEGDQLTPAVERFRQTGENPYTGDPAAQGDGKKAWDEYCQACHLPDGSGRIGPNLLDEDWNHPRDATDVGMFEILWAGGTGAMQSFKDRLSQDRMLRVIAYIRALRDAKKP